MFYKIPNGGNFPQIANFIGYTCCYYYWPYLKYTITNRNAREQHSIIKIQIILYYYFPNSFFIITTFFKELKKIFKLPKKKYIENDAGIYTSTL